MNFLRKHWYDLGGLFAIIILIYIYLQRTYLSKFDVLMWINLVTLFFHQLEEYRIVGTFPGMMNKVMFDSEIPDRYPLNTNTAFYVNVVVGWTCYFIAALLSEKAVWLGLATIVVSLGNIIAHTFIFNIKGKSLYNAGLATCWLCFTPCVYFFFLIGYSENIISSRDLLIGVPLGIALNILGVLKLIDWMKDKNTIYIFPERNLLSEDRKGNGPKSSGPL